MGPWVVLLAALALAGPQDATAPGATYHPVACSARGSAARAGYSLAALLVVSIALSRRSKGGAEPLSEEQRQKFRDLADYDE